MIGQEVSHYKILEKLGSGGMGIVYKAEDTRLKRPVALKFLPDNLSYDLEAKTRFMHEAQAASALDHPNICNIHEIDQTDDGQLFLCMTLYDGDSLKMKIQEGSLSQEKIIDIALQIATGLARAHEAGIVHRDLKPANIMFTKLNEVKIVDFGLAKLSDQTDITKEGSPIGTIAYMSPEQTRGESLDLRTDIWSFGVVLYEMLCGDRPFRGDYDQAVIYSILNESPESFQDLHRNFPKDLMHIANRCLMKDPRDRYESMIDIVHILQKLKPKMTPVIAVPDEKPAPKLSMVLKKYRRMIVITIIINIALALGIRHLLISESTIRYLAILPFTSIGQEEKNRKYCEGLIEIMTSKLTQTEKLQGSLWIIPSSEVRKYNVNRNIEYVDPAKSSCQKALKYSNQDAAIYVTCGMINNGIGEYEEAERSLKKALQIEQVNAAAYWELGKSYLMRGDRESALNTFNTAVIVRPSYWQGYSHLGYFYLVTGQYEKAIKPYKKVIEILPQSYLGYDKLAVTYFYMNRFSEAVTYGEKAIEKGSSDIIYNNLAGYYARLGKKNEAYDKLHLAQKLEITNVDTYFDIGDVYEQLGERDLALQWIGKALENGFTLAKIENNPGLDELRNDKRFQYLVKKP